MNTIPTMPPAGRYTEPFCLSDLAEKKDHLNTLTLIKIGNEIARIVNEATGRDDLAVFFVNIINLDEESKFYNPNGMIGRFQVAIKS